MSMASSMRFTSSGLNTSGSERSCRGDSRSSVGSSPRRPSSLRNLKKPRKPETMRARVRADMPPTRRATRYSSSCALERASKPSRRSWSQASRARSSRI